MLDGYNRGYALSTHLLLYGFTTCTVNRLPKGFPCLHVLFLLVVDGGCVVELIVVLRM